MVTKKELELSLKSYKSWNTKLKNKIVKLQEDYTALELKLEENIRQNQLAKYKNKAKKNIPKQIKQTIKKKIKALM